jgi:hypothetical protein
VELVDAMEDAATVDLRGSKVLPFLIRVLADDADPEVRDALSVLEAWQSDGAHRRDENGDGAYEHSEAIKIMDAWWPLLVEGQFAPVLGQQLYDRLTGMIGLDNRPHNRQGSAYIAGWYSYVEKDLRAVLGDGVAGGFSRRYCGGGTRAACEAVLRTTLEQAIAEPRSSVYQDADCDEADTAELDDQVCFDAIEYSAVGAIEQPLQRWQNRPTFQQVVEVGADRIPERAPSADTPRKRRREPRAEPTERRPDEPPAPQPAAETGELPFTGFLVAVVALLGALMLGGGLALRRTLRGESRPEEREGPG